MAHLPINGTGPQVRVQVPEYGSHTRDLFRSRFPSTGPGSQVRKWVGPISVTHTVWYYLNDIYKFRQFVLELISHITMMLSNTSWIMVIQHGLIVTNSISWKVYINQIMWIYLSIFNSVQMFFMILVQTADMHFNWLSLTS